jgi:sugar/nucleoside kinase (ribokinase family)
VDYFFPNEIEALSITGKETVSEALEELSKQVPLVVITVGSEGVIAKKRDGQVLSLKPFPVQVVDTTGAGDCFAGAFLAAYLRGGSLEDSLLQANAAGAMAVTRVGVVPEELPDQQQLKQFINTHSSKGYKVE